MGILEKFFRKADMTAARKPFTAQIIFECDLVPQNKQKVRSAVEEFMARFPDRLADNPRVTQASDGNIIEIKVLCNDREEVMEMNRHLEIISKRYGLR